MYFRQTFPRHDRKRSIHSCLVEVLLLMSSSLWGCFHTSQVTDNNEVASRSKIRPIDVDDSVAERIGQEALENIGYDKLIKLAEKAGFVESKADERIQLVTYGSVVASASVRVFSRYAFAAAVTAQADSPLPGPADIAAVGIMVIGLVDAGLLDGYLLKSVGKLLAAAGEATLPATVATDIPDDRPPPCPRNEIFSPKAMHNATGCTDKIGNIRCYSARHYPCAGAHTHGSLSYQEVRGNDCKQIIRKAVRCDGPFNVDYSCKGPTVECRIGGTETQGTFEE